MSVETSDGRSAEMTVDRRELTLALATNDLRKTIKTETRPATARRFCIGVRKLEASVEEVVRVVDHQQQDKTPTPSSLINSLRAFHFALKPAKGLCAQRTTLIKAGARCTVR